MSDEAMNRSATDRLSDALRQDADAHHLHEVELGAPDADWPSWYAEHMVQTMRRDGYELTKVPHR